jgi:hypothetical protein
MKAAYSYLRLMYMRHGTKHVRAPRAPNFVERRKTEVQLLRIHLPRTRLNRLLIELVIR